MIVRSLDYYLTTLTTVVEDTDFLRRCNPFTAYGKIADFRADNFKTLEYRVPGGALLKHPDLVNGMLSIASLVTHDILERIKIVTNNFEMEIEDELKLLKTLYPNIILTDDLFKIISSPNINMAIKCCESIQQDLRCMINYKYYEPYIEQFYSLFGKKISNNIVKTWRNHES